MNLESFEQIPIERHVINAPEFLKDGMVCHCNFTPTKSAC